MNNRDRTNIQGVLAKWQGSQGNERANYQTFFDDLCGALGVEHPIPKGTMQGDPYYFDKEIKVFHKKGIKTNFVDFHRDGHFIIEAKQGSNTSKQSTHRNPASKLSKIAFKSLHNVMLSAII